MNIGGLFISNGHMPEEIIWNYGTRPRKNKKLSNTKNGIPFFRTLPYENMSSD